MDNKVLDEAVVRAAMNSSWHGHGMSDALNSGTDYAYEVLEAALIAALPILLGEPVAWQVLDKRGEVISEYTNEGYANEILGRYEWQGSTKRALYAPSLGEGDGR